MLQIICSIKFWFCLVGTNSAGDDILDYVLSGAARGCEGVRGGLGVKVRVRLTPGVTLTSTDELTEIKQLPAPTCRKNSL